MHNKKIVCYFATSKSNTMKKIMFSLMAIVSLASCTKEELEPKPSYNPPYKIIEGYYTYYEGLSLVEDGWHIPSMDEITQSSFKPMGYDFFWTSTPHPPIPNTTGGYLDYDWIYIAFHSIQGWTVGGEDRNNKRNLVLFKN